MKNRMNQYTISQDGLRYEHCNSLDRIEAHILVLMSNCKPYTIEDLSKYLGVTDDVTTISIDRLIKLNLIIY